MNIANIFYNKREMSVRDWAIDVTVAAVAFSFGCIQLMVTASSIVVPDLAFRQYLGMVNVVPTTAAFIALALTCVPLIVRRKIPWIVFLWCFGVYLVIQTKNAGLFAKPHFFYAIPKYDDHDCSSHSGLCLQDA